MVILILPALSTVIYFSLTQLNKYPHIFNYTTKIIEDSTQKQNTIATRMLRFLRLAILLIFSLATLFTYLTATSVTNGLGAWFLPFTFGLLLIPIIIILCQSFKKKNEVDWQARRHSGLYSAGGTQNTATPAQNPKHQLYDDTTNFGNIYFFWNSFLHQQNEKKIWMIKK